MQWKRTSDYSVCSDDERFHIAKASCCGVESYTLWDGRNIVKTFKTPHEARQEAEKISKED